MVCYGLEELDAGGFDLPAGLVVGLRRDGHRLPGYEGSSRQGQSGRNGTALELQVVLLFCSQCISDNMIINFKQFDKLYKLDSIQ